MTKKRIFININEIRKPDLVAQLVAENVQMGWDNYIVPVGPDTVSVNFRSFWPGYPESGGFPHGLIFRCKRSD
jgi:hypothetical protein